MTKQELRKSIKTLLNTQTENFDAWSKQISKTIILSDVYKTSSVILAYSSLFDEVNINTVISDALKEGKKVYLPKVDMKTETMEFYPYLSESELKEGGYGILEPESNLTPFTINPNEKILVLVPGRAFTIDGKRLGRGKGYYDKYFQDKKETVELCGVCFSCQILSEIPVDSHDILMRKIFKNI